MEDFVVSARKYRPKKFDAVVGQESITNTLMRSIQGNHMAQAFLFCGPRGVGKTTCARIMARVVNEFHSGETAEVDSDYSFNIFELDAASNSGVEDIRNLIEQVRIPPQTGKYKVYIIDEVHMLSTAAFNAFLKTLEEPPAYAIFILATTEKHKVLPTILSRCQIFDFSRIRINDMVKHLKQIAHSEGIEAEDAALHLIAEKADGALRDALSIFDQMVASAGDRISYKAVIDNLNILDHEYYFRTTEAFLAGDKTELLLTFDEILKNGFDGHHFINGLADHLRNLLFCTSPQTAKILEVAENLKERYYRQSSEASTAVLMNALNYLSETDVKYRSSKNPRLLVEITLLKLSTLSGKRAEKKNSVAKAEPSATARDAAPAKPTAADAGSVAANNPAAQATAVKKPAEESPEKRASVALEPPEGSAAPPAAETPAYSEQIHAPNVAAQVEEPTSPPAKDPEAPGAAAEKPLADAQKPVASTAPAENQASGTPAGAPQATRKGLEHLLGGKKKLKGVPSLREVNHEVEALTRNKESAAGEDAANDSLDGKPVKNFNQRELASAWKAYSTKMSEEGRMSYHATLVRHEPVLITDSLIRFRVDNALQYNDLQHDKVNLLGHLREYLQNYAIDLEVVLDPELNDGAAIYDPHKKYEAMAERNPLLSDLKKDFDLDVELD